MGCPPSLMLRVLPEHSLAELIKRTDPGTEVVVSVICLIELVHGTVRERGSRKRPIFNHAVDIPEFQPMDLACSKGTNHAVIGDVLAPMIYDAQVNYSYG